MRISRALLNEPKYSTHDAVAQHGNVEVDEKADLPAAQTQIGKKLGIMDGRQSIAVAVLKGDAEKTPQYSSVKAAIEATTLQPDSSRYRTLEIYVRQGWGQRTCFGGGLRSPANFC